MALRAIYKLTDQDMQTFNSTKWVLGEWKETSGRGAMCGPGWLHSYADPRIAVMGNLIHASFVNPRIFRGEAEGETITDGFKHGDTRQRIVEELKLPIISREVSVRFAIYCAQDVLPKGVIPKWDKWAEEWLSGKDKSAAAAAAAAWAAAWAEEAAAAWAAEAAAAAVRADPKIDLVAIIERAEVDEAAIASEVEI